jgi:hypothetical protein
MAATLCLDLRADVAISLCSPLNAAVDGAANPSTRVHSLKRQIQSPIALSRLRCYPDASRHQSSRKTYGTAVSGVTNWLAIGLVGFELPYSLWSATVTMNTTCWAFTVVPLWWYGWVSHHW